MWTRASGRGVGGISGRSREARKSSYDGTESILCFFFFFNFVQQFLVFLVSIF